MEAIVYLSNVSRNTRGFENCGIFRHVMCLAQSRERKYSMDYIIKIKI